MTLFWALFGLPDLDILDLKGIDKVFTETVGLLLYAAYHVIAIVVLLNVLIAMMSSTYTRIEVIMKHSLSVTGSVAGRKLVEVFIYETGLSKW